MPAFPGSQAEKRLKAFCRSLDVEMSKEFYGFTAQGKNFLYRHATVYTVKTQSNPHYRWGWKKPLSNPAELSRMDFVLLHGEANDGPVEERFFPFRIDELQKLARRWPDLADKVSLPAHPEARANQKHTLLLERGIGRRELAKFLAHQRPALGTSQGARP